MKDDYDFGFSSLSEDKLLQDKIKYAQQEEESRLEKMYDTIMPLLTNLRKDADENNYIYWPNRKDKIDGFIQKLNEIRK